MTPVNDGVIHNLRQVFFPIKISSHTVIKVSWVGREKRRKWLRFLLDNAIYVAYFTFVSDSSEWWSHSESERRVYHTRHVQFLKISVNNLSGGVIHNLKLW